MNYPHESNANTPAADLSWLTHGSSLKITCNFDDKPYFEHELKSMFDAGPEYH